MWEFAATSADFANDGPDLGALTALASVAYPWLNSIDANPATTGSTATGFGDFYQATALPAGGSAFFTHQWTQYLATEGKVDDTDGWRWEPDLVVGTAIKEIAAGASTVVATANVTLKGAAPGLAAAAAAVALAAMF